jgi:hypothetical protein
LRDLNLVQAAKIEVLKEIEEVQHANEYHHHQSIRVNHPADPTWHNNEESALATSSSSSSSTTTTGDASRSSTGRGRIEVEVMHPELMPSFAAQVNARATLYLSNTLSFIQRLPVIVHYHYQWSQSRLWHNTVGAITMRM